MTGASSAQPIFSIVVPCHNDQSGLDEAIKSILSQSITRLEVVVVDDGSDPSVVVPSDPQVRLVRREQAGGPAIARNAGIAHSSGRYLAFCDSDDLFADGRLASALDAHQQSDLVVCGQQWLDEYLSPKGISPSRRQGSPLHGYTPSLGATTITRELCPLFSDEYLACQDIEWWVRLLECGLWPTYIDAVGYLVRRDNRVRVLNSSTARLRFSHRLLADHADFFKRDRRARAFRLLRIAEMERRDGSSSGALRALLGSVAARPSLSALRVGLSMLKSGDQS
jgi:glycosyltransferase involved in cell wall biosynthesis